MANAFVYVCKTKENLWNFQFTEEQLMIKQAARDFAVNECLPGVIERDEHAKISARTGYETG